jgi:hypothetical protein
VKGIAERTLAAVFNHCPKALSRRAKREVVNA